MMLPATAAYQEPRQALTTFFYSILKVICTLLLALRLNGCPTWCHFSVLLYFWLKFIHGQPLSMCSGAGFALLMKTHCPALLCDTQQSNCLPAKLNKPGTFWTHVQSPHCLLPPQLTSVNKMLRETSMAMLPAQDTSVPSATANAISPGATHLLFTCLSQRSVSPPGKVTDS